MTTVTTKKRNKKEWAKLAAEAHTNLCTFAHLVGILEQNNLTGHSAHNTAAKITALCHAEQTLQLSKYDEALDHV